jgi:hypothetical protein
MRVQDQDKSNCDLAYMALFWRKNQLVRTKKKKKLKKECKLGLKVVHCFVFVFFALFINFFTLVTQIM